MKNMIKKALGIKQPSIEVEIEQLKKTPTEEPKPESKEEWIWIEGYKGTHADMTCQCFQYELGAGYHIDDDKEIRECVNGFHLCLKLEDVFRYYTPGDGKRYFKVKALVRKRDYEEYGEYETSTWTMDGKLYTFSNPFGGIRNKLVAREIIFLEEVDTTLLYDEIRKTYTALKDASDDVIRTAISDSVDAAIDIQRVETLVNDGYSRAFAEYINKNDADKFEKAHALAAEKELSMDVRVLSIMTN